jgi:hypothetical protein
MKDLVRAHVREVGRHQRHAPRAGAPQRVGREQSRHQFAVGIVERLHKDSFGARAMCNPDRRFAVGERMGSYGRECRVEAPREAC